MTTAIFPGIKKLYLHFIRLHSLFTVNILSDYNPYIMIDHESFTRDDN